MEKLLPAVKSAVKATQLSLYFFKTAKHRFMRCALLLMLVLAGFTANAQTTLAAGDIAITGYNQTASTVNGAASNRDFCFVLLKNIDANTVISFTDYGWRKDAEAFQSMSCAAGTGALTDGVIEWKSTTALSYGTQIVIRCRYAPTTDVGTISATQAIRNPNTPTEYLTLATGGDCILAYQGTFASPTLITGLNVVSTWSSTSGPTGCETSPGTSRLPTALSAAGLNFNPYTNGGNARLKASVSIPTDAATARTTIYNINNWEYNATTAYQLPAVANSVSTPSAPSTPTVSALTNTGFTLTWPAVSGATSYRLDASTSNTFASFVTGFNDLTVSGASKAVTGLSANTTYYFRVRAVNSGGTSSSSTAGSILTPVKEDFINIADGASVTSFTNSVSGMKYTFTGKLHGTIYPNLGHGADNFIVDNVANCLTSAGSVGSIRTANAGYMQIKGLWVFPSQDCNVVGTGGNVVLIGKKDGVTQYTNTVLSANLNGLQNDNQGFTYVDFTQFSTSAITDVDEIEVQVTGALRYTAIDDIYYTFTPLTAASNVSFASTSQTGTTINWTNGNGTSRVVFVKAAASGSPTPVNNTTYTANSVFGSGTQIASTGWYAVYKGTGTSVAVTGLTGGTTYQAKVVEYNGATGAEVYSALAGTNNPGGVTTGAAGVLLSSSPTITFSNNTGLADNIAEDGEAGSTAINDINIQSYPINSSGVKVTASPVEFHQNGDSGWAGYPAILVYNSNPGNYGWTIKSSDGSKFSLQSINFFDWAGWDGGNFKAEAFNGGTSKGVLEFAGNTGFNLISLSQTSGTPAYKLPAAFGNVDEIKFYRTDQADTWISFNNIKVGSPVATTPTISTTGTLSALTTTQGTASSAGTFSVSGADMAAGILVTPPAGFEVSLASGSGYASTVTVGAAGTIASTPVYIRLAAATAVGSYSGNVVLSSSGASNASVATVSSTVAAGTSTIASIVRADASPTNAATVNYTVTFGTSITGLTASNFSLSGTATGASIGTVTGSGTTWTVPVTTGAVQGTIILNLANATGLTPGISTTLPFIGETYTIDKTQPTLSSGSYYSNNGTSSQYAKVGDVITLTVGFNEALQTCTFTIAGHAVTTTGSNANRNWTGTYTVVSGDTEGNVPWTIAATDLAGNVRNYTNNDFGTYLVFDQTNPTIAISAPSASSSTGASVSYTITYTDATFNSSTLSNSDVTLNATGTATGTIAVDGGTGSSRTVTINNISGTGTLGISIAANTASDVLGQKAPAAGPSATFTVTPPPVITTTGTLSALSTTQGTASSAGTFNVAGTNMAAGILVTPPTGYEVSLASGSGYASTVTVGAAGTIASTPVYIRLAATTATGNYSGNIVLSSTGASSVNVATVSSTVSAPIPAPSITANPSNSTICAGANTTFTATADNATGYQWQVDQGAGFSNIANGAPYSGANTATLTITTATAGLNGYVYRLVATGVSSPAATSNNASLTINSAPSITANPSASTICAGANTTFTATASNATGYQWQVDQGAGFSNVPNTAPYSGTTSATLTITGATAALNGYIYRVVVSGTCTPNATSNNAALTINSAPSITANPSARTICAGANTTFTATASNATGYQWQVDQGAGFSNVPSTAPYSGTTSATLTITGATAALNGYIYRVVVSGTCTPAATSNNASLTINSAPSITANPSASTICAGANTTFTATASNATGYQWQVDQGAGFSNVPSTAPYSGTTSATLTITGATAALNGYIYRVVVSGTCTPNATSNNAALTINSAPSITANPSASTVQAGANTTFTVSANNATGYQWQVNQGAGFSNIPNGAPYSGATTATLTITGATSGMNGYTYRAVMSGVCTPAASSNAATLTVNTPTISTSGTLSALTTTQGTASSAGTFNVSGAYMTAGILVTAPTGFEVSLASGSGYASTVTIGSIGTITSTPVYIRLASTSTVGSYSGNVVLSSSGATNVNVATASSSVTPSADLAVTVTDGVTTATAGGSTTYTITVSNSGPSNITGATVADTFPAALSNVTWTGVGAGGGTVTASGSGNINQTVNLPAGASVTFTVNANISAAASGSLSNTATVSLPSGATDPNPSNNSATDINTINKIADLAITITDGVTTYQPGNTLTYTITVSNNGPSNVSGATVADTFPASLTNVTWSTAGAGGGTATASGSGNINDSVNLPSGSSVVYTVTANVALTATGTLSNTATVTAPAGATDPTPGNNSATDSDSQVFTAQTITFAATDNKTYGTADYTPAATSTNSGIAITYTSSNTGIATIVNGKIHVVKAGTVSITASQAGDIIHSAATDVVQILTINPALLTITATGPNKVYGTALTAGTSTTNFTAGATQNGETVTSVTLTPNAAGLSATTAANATYVVTPSAATGTNGFLASNYTVTYVPFNGTVSKAALTITATGPNKVYGTALTAGTSTINFTAGTTQNSETVTSVTLTPNAAGLSATTAANAAYVVTPSAATGTNGFLASNYTVTYVPFNGTVGKAALTITATGPNKVYGTALTAGTSTTNFTAGATQNSETITSVTLTPDAAGLSATTAANAAYVVTPSAATGTNGFLASNYTVTYVPYNGTVSKAALTITATGPNKVYGTALTAGTSTTNFTAGATQNSETVTSVTLTPDAAGLSATTAANAAYIVTPSAATGTNGFLASNYTVTYVPYNGTVSKAALTITATGPNKVYGTALTAGTSTTNFTAGATQNSETVTSVTLTPDAAGLSATTAANAAYVVTPSAATGTNGFLASNYTVTYVPFNGTVSTAPLTVTASTRNKTYGQSLLSGAGNTFFTSTGLQNNETIGSVTANYSAGNAATAAVGTYTAAITPSIATGGTFTAGNYTITYVKGDVVVDKAALTITATGPLKVYGTALTAGTSTANFTASATQNSETVTSVTLTPNAAGLSATTVAGAAYVVAPSLATGTNGFLASNYNITYTPFNGTVTKAALTITADNKSKNYGDANPALTPSYNGFVNSDNAASLTTAPTLSTTATTASAVGIYPVTASGAVSSNYTISYVAGKLTVNKAALTITATDPAKAYGTALTAGVSTTGFAATAAQNGEVATSVTLTPDAAGAAVTTAAGVSYTVTPSAATGTGGFVESNYNVNYVPFTGTVAKRIIAVTAAAKTKVYGDTDPALTYTFTPALIGNDAFSGAISRATGENVGTYTIGKNTLALSANYTLNYTSADLTITKANLTIAADNKSKAYGTANPALTVTYTGLTNGDTNASLATQPVIATTATANSAVGTYPITASGAVSNNYNITYTPAVLTVNTVVLTVTAENKSKIYGASNPALTVAYSGFVNGDTQANITTAPSIVTTATASSNTGAYTITASGVAIPNYTIAYVAGTLTVNKAQLIITADNKSKTFGTANPVLTASYSGFVNGDTNASLLTQPTISNGATTTTAPGSYDITVSGATSNNYTITNVSGKLTIIPLTNAAMSNLSVATVSPSIGAIVLSPNFTPGTTAYTLPVSYDVTRVTITASYDATASATINGTAIPNGSKSFTVDVPAGQSTITVVVTAQDGITKTSYTIAISKSIPPTAVTPTNILSPNGDGKNDTWVIKDIERYPNNEVKIFDKGGRMIYSRKGYQNDWNGTLNGAPLLQGTYFYIVELERGLPPIKGFITILKNQ